MAQWAKALCLLGVESVSTAPLYTHTGVQEGRNKERGNEGRRERGRKKKGRLI